MQNYFYLLPLLGYLIGSISPAYILGRILKGIDIRQHGTKNAGTRNVKKILGLWPAVFTALFDLSKGLLSMVIAWKLDAPEIIIYITGYAAVLGHIFPFYLKFRGGEGSATGVAILIFLITKSIIRGWFPYEILIPAAVLALSILYIARIGEIVGAVVLPVFIALLLLKTQINPTTIFITVILAQLFVVTLYNIKKLNLFILDKSREQMLHWRTLLRPLAALFVILPFYIPKDIILYIVGSIAAVFIILDLGRLFVSSLNIFLFNKATGLLKDKERSKFSSMTFFLTAVFILLLVFPQNIASCVILFLVFGDLAAKIFGLQYGRQQFLTKTFEGSLAYFAFSLIAGYIFSFFLPLPFWVLILGALSASITEALSIFGIDDNFTVGLISASVMLALMSMT
ncbi:MAG: glycerol-3-phosphate acyltransferase [Candidatus Berkelbacteria bacterium]|nr:glycerol-3-phosphate acyltransferase [Candidatus Berkelbacteria bacterium]